MEEMFLLGAGASVEAGVPDSYNMTKKIMEKLNNRPKYAKILNFVVGGLLFQEGVKGHNPLNSGVNVEDLFNAVQLLAERNMLEAAPFVGSWHSRVDEFDEIEPSLPNMDALIQEIYKGMPLISKRSSRPNKTAIAAEFKKASSQSQPKPGEGRTFKLTAESMISTLSEIVWISSPERVCYLAPLINFAEKQDKTIIATLNYDNAIELAADSNNISCNTGIDYWSMTGNFDTRQNGLHLLKLHGSIDWKWNRKITTDARQLPHSTIEKVNIETIKKNSFRPAVIFGQRNKLTAEGPFLDLLMAFRSELMRTDKLTVIGYSFGDNHINTYISQWLNKDKRNLIRVIDPKFEKSSEKYTKILKKFRMTNKDQVEIYGKFAGQALNELFGN